jgi:hypothetical protein
LETVGRLLVTAGVHEEEAVVGRRGRLCRMQADSVEEPGLCFRSSAVLQQGKWLVKTLIRSK